MDREGRFAALGLPATATAAEIEERYLALSQFLDPRLVPPALRQWASAESSLIDEAYAALLESVDDEATVDDRAERPRAALPASAPAPAMVVKPRAAVIETPGGDDEYYEELDEEDRHPSRPYSRPSVQPPAVPSPVQSRGTAGRPRAQWQEQGHPGRRRPVPSTQGRQRYAQKRQGPDLKLIIGGAAAVVVVAVLALVYYQVWPFTPPRDETTGEQIIPINEGRYNQLKGIVQSDSKNFPALFELGEMTFEAQEYEESIIWLEQALLVRPDDVQSILDVGTANFNLGNREKASEMWQRALKVDPNNPQTHWNLGFYYASKQPADIDSAVREWQLVLQFSSPQDQLYKLAQTHLDQYLKGGAAPK